MPNSIKPPEPGEAALYMFSHGDSGVRSDDLVMVISNAPDLLLAKRIAHVLVEEGLAACVNLGAAGLSMYMWAGRLEGGEEIPIIMKTTRARVHELVARLQQLHPDEVPEILVLPVLGGLTSYVDWVRERTALA